MEHSRGVIKYISWPFIYVCRLLKSKESYRGIKNLSKFLALVFHCEFSGPISANNTRLRKTILQVLEHFFLTELWVF